MRWAIGWGIMLLLLPTAQGRAEEGEASPVPVPSLRLVERWKRGSISEAKPFRTSVWVGEEVRWTATLWIAAPSQRPSSSPLERFLRASGLMETTTQEEPLAYSAVQTEVAKQGSRGRVALGMTSVGRRFAGQAPLAPGTRQWFGEGTYRPRQGLEVRSRYLEQTRTDFYGRERPLGEWSLGIGWALAPGHRFDWEWERREQDWGTAWERVEESESLSLEQQWTPALRLQAAQTVRRREEGGQESQEVSRRASATLRPSQDLKLQAGGETREATGRPSEAKTEVQWEWRVASGLFLSSRYLGQRKGERSQHQRSAEMDFLPHPSLRLSGTYEEEVKGEQTTLRRRVGLEIRPGPWRWESLWAQEERGGKETLTQSLLFAWQPAQRLHLVGRYQRQEPRPMVSDITRAAQVEMHPSGSLSLQGEWQERERPGREESLQRLAASLRWGGTLQVETSLAEEQRDEQEKETFTGRLRLRPGRPLFLEGVLQEQEAAAQRQQTQEAKMTLRPGPWGQWEGEVRIQQPESGRESRFAAAALSLRPWSAFSLQSRYRRQEMEGLGVVQEGATLGMDVGGRRHRLFSEAQMERSLSVAQRYLARYRLGYQLRTGGVFLSLEGSMERRAWGRWGWWNAPEYQGEVELRWQF